ncbi:DNA-directed RNA polymerase subunit [Forsythia ovata]|uniref:DNA-directed RNA polymerase subunit n=1 Tax=Forsythia ovata TaxID=205694 RepID=A0ABD1UBA8_9LAMI
MNMSCNVEKDCSVKIVRVDTKDGFEHLEKRSLTEEYGLPTCLCIPTSSETESIENSSKRKRHSCPIDGNITRLLFEVKKQKKHDTLYNEDRTDILPQHKDEKFCYISEGTGNIGRGFPQTDEAINHLISKLIGATAQGKRGTRSSTIASLTSLQRVASQYKNLFENWVPLLLQAVHPDPDDEDWLFQRKSQYIHSENTLKSCSNKSVDNMTEYSRQRDFMFCEICGTMLSFDSPKYAQCPLCKFKKRIKDISGRKIRYTITAEDMRRELGMSSLDDIEEEKELKQMDYNAKCKACQHLGMAYVARQSKKLPEIVHDPDINFGRLSFALNEITWQRLADSKILMRRKKIRYIHWSRRSRRRLLVAPISIPAASALQLSFGLNEKVGNGKLLGGGESADATEPENFGRIRIGWGGRIRGPLWSLGALIRIHKVENDGPQRVASIIGKRHFGVSRQNGATLEMA